MKKVIHYLDENLEEVIMLVFLAIITFSIMLNVIMRYIFKNALAWPEELSRYCFVYSGMLSAGYCMKKNKSFNIDLLYNVLPKPVRIVIDYAGKFLVLFLYGYMTYGSFSLIQVTSTVSTAMRLPMKYVYMAIPIGMGIGVIRTIQNLVVYTRNLLKKEDKE